MNKTVENVLQAFDNVVFYYEIICKNIYDNSYVIINEVTCDQLYRHVIDDFGSFIPNCFDVVKENEKYYLTMTLTIDDSFDYNDDYLEQIATKENMIAAFDTNEYDIDGVLVASMDNKLSFLTDGKFVIPKYFTDSVYIEYNDGQFTHEKSFDAIFKFSKAVPVDNEDFILDYIC
jgi:hypothetical protein